MRFKPVKCLPTHPKPIVESSQKDDSGANTSCMFPIELLGVKSNPAKSARNLGVIFDKNFTFRSHISVVCNSWFYHMRDLRRIRRHLDLDSAQFLATAPCPVVLIIVIHFCMVLLTLTSLGFSMYRINWPTW